MNMRINHILKSLINNILNEKKRKSTNNSSSIYTSSDTFRCSVNFAQKKNYSFMVNNYKFSIFNCFFLLRFPFTYISRNMTTTKKEKTTESVMSFWLLSADHYDDVFLQFLYV